MADEHIVQPRVYIAVFVALIVLTGLTAAVAFVDLGLLNPVVALSIAILKATVVVLFFMHLRWSTRLTWIVGVAGLFWVGILFALSLSDYLTRSWGRL